MQNKPSQMWLTVLWVAERLSSKFLLRVFHFCSLKMSLGIYAVCGSSLSISLFLDRLQQIRNHESYEEQYLHPLDHLHDTWNISLGNFLRHRSGKAILLPRR